MMENRWKQEKNLTMLLDFYELTMANGYFKLGVGNQTAVFDMFFRKIPDQAGFAICAGLEQLIDYFENLHFTKEDIEYLRGRGMFDEDFLDYLANFHFECDVWAVPEGTPIFPNEPVLIVKGPIIQAQLVETMVLLTINHQSLIATKSNRIVRAAQGRSIMEFGSRRAQSYDAAILGARPRISPGAMQRPARSPTGTTGFRQWEQWLTVGFRCSVMNMKRSKNTRNFIRIIVCSW